ncbi:alginate lyase [Pedobacter ginsengisoli]|uniref:Alginate lyase n=1 Tax=Pedobacter ginsengisoli TaxID=363852 RepID=A0A2D1U2F8_9SPHI|nr:polysaccharide lyase 6 family protein [Pedobacter ginsengisoli]ATP55779.1 alginate lyase [Pedobacter ginsengisoli]
MNKVILIAFVLLCSTKAVLHAKDYKIKNANELNTLSLKSGDKVIMLGELWKDQQLIFKGKGTKEKPITLGVEFPGKTILSGNSTLVIDGTWLIADGLSFTDGFIEHGDVIQFSPKSTWCRLTNTSVVNFNNPNGKADYRWVSLNGFNNRVDHCMLQGKNHQGVTLVVWLTDKPNYHKIDHNYFGPRPELGRNGGETIRIGTSTWSFHDSYTIVEDNIFDHCDGELEAVSVKSCKNTIRNNLFYETRATLTLRHGNGSDVYGNYFIGNFREGTGGVRIIGEDHKVHDNYFYGLTGTGVSAAISVMAGLPNPVLTSHWQVKNAIITNNKIVACKEPFAVGAGYNPERNLPALNTTFADNVIIPANAAIKWYDTTVVVKLKNNKFTNGARLDKLPEVFTSKLDSIGPVWQKRKHFNFVFKPHQ